MADLLKTGVEWLAAQAREHVSRLVTYRRGATVLTGVPAVVSSSVLRVADRNGNVRIVRTERDYLIWVDDLAALGQPADGDLIDDATDGRRYEVRPVMSEPAWRYSDARHERFRVHCKGAADL